jgi:2-oxoglutarate/2-oxoacid ferredoxin oxidoreductase subunit alpha
MGAAVEINSAVVRFAGDSGDGMQVVGEQFTDSSALIGNDISTFPDFPAEIRAPIGTLPGVSGFQVQFGARKVLTPGDAPDALVVMNPAALKVNLADLHDGGLLVINTDAFTEANLKKAGYEDNPLENGELEDRFDLIKVQATELTKEALKESPIKPTDKVRCKNFFMLGFMYWIYGRSIEYTSAWIYRKWGHLPEVSGANEKALKSGFFLGETLEKTREPYLVGKVSAQPGTYRKISGNEALVLGLVTASKKADLGLLYSGYPITPASAILEGCAKHKNYGVLTIQAEDEMAAMGIAIGASFTGKLAVTATSGPGICLKGELMGLALSAELPVIVVNVQRGGPSTGLPTKTEQSDLFLSLYGRHGESSMPIVAARSPAHCFEAAIEAARITLTYNTPVMLLSDGYVANGSEPWKLPRVKDIPKISPVQAKEGDDFVTFRRDPETLARTLAIPGTPGLEHRLGGLERDEEGNVSYDPQNHEDMSRLRAEKVAGIEVPPAEVSGQPQGEVLVLGWGGTFGAIYSAVDELQQQGLPVSSVHLTHLNPLPANLKDVLKSFNHVLVPELNHGQLCKLIRAEYLVDAKAYNKMQGRPFTVTELKTKIREFL